MRLDDNDIKELVAIHESVTGEKLSREEASEIGENLVRFGLFLCREKISTGDEFDSNPHAAA